MAAPMIDPTIAPASAPVEKGVLSLVDWSEPGTLVIPAAPALVEEATCPLFALETATGVDEFGCWAGLVDAGLVSVWPGDIAFSLDVVLMVLTIVVTVEIGTPFTVVMVEVMIVVRL